MRTTLLRNISWLYTCDQQDAVMTNAYVCVTDGRIASIGQEPCPITNADEEIDLEGHLVTPGLINLHHHFYQTLTRAVPEADRTNGLDWLFSLYPLWAGLDPEAMYWSSMTALAELVKSGATTVADHSYLAPGGSFDYVQNQVAAARALGVRFHLVRGSMVTIEGDLATRLKPVLGEARLTRLLDDEAELPARLEAALALHDPSPFSMLRIALGPTGVTYAKPQLMKLMARLAGQVGAGLHTHFHPRQIERGYSRELTGMEPIDFLEETGWLRPGTWMAHCTELDDEEIRRFAAAGVGIAHCPRTVVRLGYKMPRIVDWRAAGINVGVGVDGSASNDGGSLLSDLRLAAVMHRINDDEGDLKAKWMSPYDALLMATRVGARVLGRDDIGSIALGKAADIAAFDMRRLCYVGSLADPLGGLMLAGTEPDAGMTMIAGQVVVRDGRLLSGDEADIIANGNRCARALRDRFVAA
jgi:8-oxoguanine deaminase